MERENENKLQTWFHDWNGRQASIIYNKSGRRGDRSRGQYIHGDGMFWIELQAFYGTSPHVEHRR
jgi:hypothetical protein